MRPFQPLSSNPEELKTSQMALWQKFRGAARLNEVLQETNFGAIRGGLNDVIRFLRGVPNAGDWRSSKTDNPATIRFGTDTSYVEIGEDGDISFFGGARINLKKTAASSVTLTVGTSSDSVADLRTFNDGNIYSITEAASTPGLDLIVDFESVSVLNHVDIKAVYDGAATHAVSLQLYDWIAADWATFSSIHYSGIDIQRDVSFFVPDQVNYIGSGDNNKKVRVRFNHTMLGNASHDLHISYVALY